MFYHKPVPERPSSGLIPLLDRSMPCRSLPSAAAWRGVLGPATPIGCPGRSLGPFCRLRAALPLRRGRRRRSGAAPKIARSRWKYILLQYSQNFCTACRPRRIHNYEIQYKHGADRRSLEPRPTDGGAPCAVAERLRGRRRTRGCALDRRSASLARGPCAGRQQRAATCRAPIYPEVV